MNLKNMAILVTLMSFTISVSFAQNNTEGVQGKSFIDAIKRNRDIREEISSNTINLFDLYTQEVEQCSKELGKGSNTSLNMCKSLGAYRSCNNYRAIVNLCRNLKDSEKTVQNIDKSIGKTISIYNKLVLKEKGTQVPRDRRETRDQVNSNGLLCNNDFSINGGCELVASCCQRIGREIKSCKRVKGQLFVQCSDQAPKVRSDQAPNVSTTKAAKKKETRGSATPNAPLDTFIDVIEAGEICKMSPTDWENGKDKYGAPGEAYRNDSCPQGCAGYPLSRAICEWTDIEFKKFNGCRSAYSGGNMSLHELAYLAKWKQTGIRCSYPGVDPVLGAPPRLDANFNGILKEKDLKQFRIRVLNLLQKNMKVCTERNGERKCCLEKSGQKCLSLKNFSTPSSSLWGFQGSPFYVWKMDVKKFFNAPGEYRIYVLNTDNNFVKDVKFVYESAGTAANPKNGPSKTPLITITPSSSSNSGIDSFSKKSVKFSVSNLSKTNAKVCKEYGGESHCNITDLKTFSPMTSNSTSDWVYVNDKWVSRKVSYLKSGHYRMYWANEKTGSYHRKEFIIIGTPQVVPNITISGNKNSDGTSYKLDSSLSFSVFGLTKHNAEGCIEFGDARPKQTHCQRINGKEPKFSKISPNAEWEYSNGRWSTKSTSYMIPGTNRMYFRNSKTKHSTERVFILK
jgi:hypothetical protein